jgi:uridylate kinase
MASMRPIRARTRRPSVYETLTYLEMLARDLAVMDAAAISVARENHLPIIVFNIHEAGAFTAVMKGEGRFTTVTDTP